MGDGQEGARDLKDGRAEALDRFARSRVARMATVTETGQSHIVPITFALDGERVFTMVDSKPKSTTNLKRLQNIDSEPRVTLLADHYEEEWSSLWWTRIDGTAQVETAGHDWDAARRLLTAKYPQYRKNAPEGALIAITIQSVTWWQWSP